MSCQICSNRDVSCALYNSTKEGRFMISLCGSLQKRVHVPCHIKNMFNGFTGSTPEMCTTEGISFLVNCKKERNITIINGEGWADFATQFRLKDGDIVKFRLLFQEGYIQVRAYDQYKMRRTPFFGTRYQGLNVTDRELVESLVLCDRGHLASEEMDTIVQHLAIQGKGQTKPLLHYLTPSNVSSYQMKVANRVGPLHLKKAGQILMVRHIDGPDGEEITQDGMYKIRAGDWRIEVTVGWKEFVEKNQDFKTDDKVLISVHKRNGGLLMYVEKIPFVGGMCIKC